MQKMIPILGICLVSFASCKNNTDCSATTQQLQDQLNAKDSRIRSLEDSLHMFAGGNGTSSSPDTANRGATNNAGGKESSYYRENHSSVSRHGTGTYPGEFPEGSERLLTKNDVFDLSEWGLQVIKGEIYARHGGTFNDKFLQSHFNHQSWYHAKGSNVNGSLSGIEKKNIEFLNGYKYPYNS